MEIKSYITFIIPTIGRKTLPRAIKSLYELNDSNWKAIIVFDGVEPNLPKKYISDKISIYQIPKSGSKKGPRSQAGKVRNYAFQFVDSEWIGFLDDDDYLRDNYIQCLKEEDNGNLDFILFRMMTTKETPTYGINDIRMNEAGISFSIKNQSLKKFDAKFNNDDSEDYWFLKHIVDKGAKYKVSKHITYDVCRNHPKYETMEY